jgi:hypothetical protein
LAFLYLLPGERLAENYSGHFIALQIAFRAEEHANPTARTPTHLEEPAIFKENQYNNVVSPQPEAVLVDQELDLVEDHPLGQVFP